MTSLLIPYATNPLLPDPVEIITAIVFVIILTVIIAKFVVPRFEATYAERTAAIQGGIEKAEKAQAEAEAALETVQAQLAEARSEAAKIREDAKTQGTQILAELREQAQAEASRIRLAARGSAGGRAHSGPDPAAQRDRWPGHHPRRPDRRGVAGRRRAGSPHCRPVPGRPGVRLHQHSGGRPDGRASWRTGWAFSTVCWTRSSRPTSWLTISSRSSTRSTVRPPCGGCSPTRGHRRTPARRSPRGVLGGKVSDAAVALVETAVRRRWAGGRTFTAALERQAVRAQLMLADRAGHLDETEDELFRFARLVESDSSLRNALSERSIDRSFRENLVGELLDGKASLATIVLAKRAVAARERSYGHTLEGYITLAAAQKNRVIATVRVARPLTEEQLQRLRAGAVTAGRTRHRGAGHRRAGPAGRGPGRARHRGHRGDGVRPPGRGTQALLLTDTHHTTQDQHHPRRTPRTTELSTIG